MINIKYIVGLLLFGTILNGQNWKPAMDGIGPAQRQSSGDGITIKFKTNGPLGKDWIYGNYVDEDSLTRCVAYRDGGSWVAVPFSCYKGSQATDIEMYGDTLYIAGAFGDVVLDKDSSLLPETGILKYYNDSIWAADSYVAPNIMSSKGDSLLIWGGYLNPQDSSIIYPHVITADKGQTWQYPYSITHPTESNADFGPITRFEILDNGDILTLNGGSPSGNKYKGIVRWDGQQWHSYGNGLYGSGYTYALDFVFYKGDLHMGGTFANYTTLGGDTTAYYPQNPGNAIVRWDGSQWQGLANGILEGGVFDLFVHDSILYAFISGGYSANHQFGDANIEFFAGWDGQQWCGTPTNYQNVGPMSYGVVNDTLFVFFDDVRYNNGTVDGTPVDYIMYYDGDYLHGPNAVCSTPGLGEKEQETETGGIRLYPNPARDIFSIVSNTGDPLHKVKVYDINGQCVLEQSDPKDYQAQIDVSSLPPGVYLVNINERYNQKLVIR